MLSHFSFNNKIVKPICTNKHARKLAYVKQVVPIKVVIMNENATSGNTGDFNWNVLVRKGIIIDVDSLSPNNRLQHDFG